MFRHLLNFFLWTLPVSRFFIFRRRLWAIAGVDIGRDAKMCGHSWVYGRGHLAIGDRTWIGPGGLFYTHEHSVIRIGTDCDIAPQVMFVTGSHAIGNDMRRAGEGKSAPIIIGNGCWLGARVTVLGGVTIGSGAIVAAGALVTRDVPPHTLVGGVPARFIRSLKAEQP